MFYVFFACIILFFFYFLFVEFVAGTFHFASRLAFLSHTYPTHTGTPMKRRLTRKHWSGSSNRVRSRKNLDISTALNFAPRNKVMAENHLSASMSKTGLTRSVVVFDPPQLIKTKLGGVYYVKERRCQAAPYQEMIQDSYLELRQAGLVQGPWSSDQPPLGIPVWSNDPPKSSPFDTCGKSAPHAVETQNAVASPPPPICGIPTRGVMQNCR